MGQCICFGGGGWSKIEKLGLLHLIRQAALGKRQEMEYGVAALKRKAKQAKPWGLWCRKKGVQRGQAADPGHVSRRSWGQQDTPLPSCWCPGWDGGTGGQRLPSSSLPGAFPALQGTTFGKVLFPFRSTPFSNTTIYLLLALGEWGAFGFDCIFKLSSLWNRSSLQKSMCHIYVQFEEQ